MAFGLATAAHGDPLTVKTAQGTVHGKTINEGKVRAFLGLPYAAPPLGELRWKAPEPPAKWKGVREAAQFGARCMQTHPFEDIQFQDSGPSEDCLYLNVYTPADAVSGDARKASKLPVMFWIHGGDYIAGSASEPRHNGDFLPLKGVVLVTINYRLGVFGFLATTDLAKEAGGSAGNYGLMDAVAALRWVRANIAAFGGDAKNVTIFGESAGSFAVSTLVAAAPARGLFAKAIGESGGALNVGDPGALSAADHQRQEQEWIASLGVSSLAEARKLPAETLMAAAEKLGLHGFPPVVDGKLLTEPVADTYAAGRQAHVPILAGWNRDENVDLAAGMTAAKWKAKMEQIFGTDADKALTFYPADSDAQAVRSSIDYTSDAFIAFTAWRWIDAQTKTGDAPVYRYHMELPAPPSRFHPGSYVFHSDDIEYVFGTLDTRPGAVWRPEDRKLSDEMMSYWTNFARTGDPMTGDSNGAGLTAWPRFDRDGMVLHLDSTITASTVTTGPRYEFLEKWLSAIQP